MFKKNLVVALTIVILFISVLTYAGPLTYEDLKGLYPEMTWGDAQQYEYTIEEYGPDYYLIEIEGTWYLVQF
ncbi:MAG: hypothetical protein DRI23_05645 [Candidatus Cloacimonadota bacterium]|nr:MAG: hypothetical protein DRI23_05645 [Candidatus Cloacimonadota bacterium]